METSAGVAPSSPGKWEGETQSSEEGAKVEEYDEVKEGETLSSEKGAEGETFSSEEGENLSSEEGENLSSEEGEEVDGYVEVDLEDSDSYWDKDSFDGREYDPSEILYCSDDDIRNQLRLYRRTVIETKGFFEYDEGFPDMISSGIGIVWDLEEYLDDDGITVREFIGNMASECVEKYNKREKKNMRFDHLVRANFNPSDRTKYYITFAARESDLGPLVEYQAKAIWCAGETYPVLCRPSPLCGSLKKCAEREKPK